VREWSGAAGPAARHALAAALASGAALHPAVRRHRHIIDQIREAWRRSGGTTPHLDHAALVALYEQALGGVSNVHEWRSSPVTVDWEAVMPASERAHWMSLPAAAEVRGRALPLEYDVETDAEGQRTAIARIRVPEKLANQLEDEDIPELDRPVRFIVYRGAKGVVKANTLAELREKLAERVARREEGRGEDARRDRFRDRKGKHRSTGRPPWRGKPRRRR
jgi:hypothetical protein